jgi:hypothetical protein
LGIQPVAFGHQALETFSVLRGVYTTRQPEILCLRLLRSLPGWTDLTLLGEIFLILSGEKALAASGRQHS